MNTVVEFIDKIFINLGFVIDYLVTEGIEIMIGLIIVTFFVSLIFKLK